MPPYINIHTHHPAPDSLSVVNVRLQNEHPTLPMNGLFSAGIHPWDAADATSEWLDIFSADHTGLIAIGEIGLDYRPEYSLRELQQQWFERQVTLANKLAKPLIIHNVHATDDTLQLLKSQAAVPAILHGFTGSPELAGQCLRAAADLHLSFGPTTMHSVKTLQALRQTFAKHPDRFFLETDDNPTVTIGEMYIFAADLLEIDTAELQQRIEQNFNTLFPNIIIR